VTLRTYAAFASLFGIAFRLALILAAIQALISDSTQPTERAPSDTGEGNSPAAMRL